MNKIHPYAFILVFNLVLFSVTALAQPVSVSHADTNPGVFAESHIETYKNNIHIICADKAPKLTLRYSYSADKGLTWQSEELDLIYHGYFENREISSTIDKKGIFHAVYFSIQKDLIHISKTLDGQWKRDTVWKRPAKDDPAYPKVYIESDTKGRLNILYQNGMELNYFLNDGNGWIRRQLNEDIFTFYVSPEAFCLDDSCNLYLLDVNRTEKLTLYKSVDGGKTWKGEKPGNTYCEDEISMVIDHAGTPHICFIPKIPYSSDISNDTLISTFTYLYKTPQNTWTTIPLEKITLIKDDNYSGLDDLQIPRIRVDEQNGIHITYITCNRKSSNVSRISGDTIPYFYRAAGTDRFNMTKIPFSYIDKESYIDLSINNGNAYITYVGNTDPLAEEAVIEFIKVMNRPDAPENIPAAENETVTNCKAMLQGTFYYGDPESPALVIIKGKKYTEYINKKQYYIKYKISWVNDCEYNRTLKETNLPNNVYKAGDVFNVKITKVKNKRVYYTVTVNGKQSKDILTKME